MRVLGVVLSESVGSDPRRTPAQMSESEAEGWYSPDVKNGLYGEPAYTLEEDMLGWLGNSEERRGYICAKNVNKLDAQYRSRRDCDLRLKVLA